MFKEAHIVGPGEAVGQDGIHLKIVRDYSADVRQHDQNEQPQFDQESSEQDFSNSSSSSSSSSSSDGDAGRAHFAKREYYNFEPLYLDTSTLRQGQHLTVVQLPSVRISFMPYRSKE